MDILSGDSTGSDGQYEGTCLNLSSVKKMSGYDVTVAT